jgi:general secretion pathway protein L
MIDLAAQFPTFVRLARPMAAAWRWWSGEMRTLFAALPWTAGRRSPVVRVGVDGALPDDAPAGGRAVELRLPAAVALSKTVTLPAVAEENLRGVLAFEMDRETPFRAEDVRFAARVTGRADRQIRVTLTVVPRPPAARALEAAARRGLVVARLTVEAADGTVVDLTDPAERPAARRTSRLLPALVGVLALAVAVVPPLMSLWRAEQLDARIAALQERAGLALRLRAELDRRSGAASSLDVRKARTTLALAVLAELSVRLPDGVWLDQVRLSGAELRLSGYAPAAAELIAVLDDSPLLSAVRFETGVVQDPVHRRERFQIAATVEGRAP